LAKQNLIGKRLVEAFGTDDKAFIAEKLGFSTVQAVYKVISGERELDFEKLQNFRNYTKRSIDWLLTGAEPTAFEAERPTEDALIQRVREIVREELSAASTAVQDLGSVDDFDIAAAVEKYDNALLVLRDWYAHDNVAIALPQTLDFQGWETYTLEKKVQEIKAAREIMDHNRYLEERLENSHRIKGSK
jgi:hypothetical protein